MMNQNINTYIAHQLDGTRIRRGYVDRSSDDDDDDDDRYIDRCIHSISNLTIRSDEGIMIM